MADYRFTDSNELSATHLNLKHTIESGQPLTFLADYDWKANRFSYVDGKNKTVLSYSDSPKETTVRLKMGHPLAMENFAERFRLNESLGSIYKKINTDKFMEAAISNYAGMRLTKNDPWETTVCFIASQYNNMKRIRKNVQSLVSAFGTKNPDGSIKFPTSEQLSMATEKQLWACGLGFRAKYIKHAASYCTENMDLNRLGRKEYSLLKDSLMEIHGVGDKVADCIALMGYGRLEAFPIDVWVKRTMEKAYFGGKPKKIEEIHEFAIDQWGKHRGYAQQYIFFGGMNL